MGIKRHMALLSVCLAAWAFFYIVGLPSDYFLKWRLAEQTLLSLITFFAIVPALGVTLILFLGEDYVKTSLWFAFYASVPLFLLDYMMEGIIKGEGLHFLISHWYLGIAYIYVWIELPIIGLAIRRLATLSQRGPQAA